MQSNTVDEVGFHQPHASSVKEYAYTEDKNYKFRPQMEDVSAHKDRVNNDASCGLFCVFDGHGGKQVADHCAERIPIELQKELNKNPQELCNPIISVFDKIDNELRLIDGEMCGATACVAVIRREGNH